MKKLWGFCVDSDRIPGGLFHALGMDGADVGCCTGSLLFGCVGNAGNSSFVVFFGATVVDDDVTCC